MIRLRNSRPVTGTTLVGLLTVAALAVGGCTPPQTPDAANAAKDGMPAAAPSLSSSTFVRYSTRQSWKLRENGLPSSTRTIRAGIGGHITVRGASLEIPRDALSSDTEITLTLTNDTTMEVAIEPTGLTFSTPATLTFNYAGTTADPNNPNYVPGALEVLWFDPSGSSWVSVGGTDNGEQKRLSVLLDHLSYYSLSKRGQI